MPEQTGTKQALPGKVVLVTGASSGIGAATAAALLQAGARVAAAARRVERLHELGRTLGAGADAFLPLQADVCDESAAAALIERTLAWGGRLNALVNNAGLARGDALENGEAGDIRLMLETNLLALANLTRIALPALRSTSGDLINISSTAALAMPAGAAVYAASKAAVAAFSEALRKEVSSSGIRVTTVYPGFVSTEFYDGFPESKRAKLLQLAQTMDALRSEDVAEVIAFALTRPAHVALNEIVVRPTRQPS